MVICRGKLTAGFIITGPNIASQDLLFEQLAERLSTATRARFVRLRASEATNLKAALKKIIRDATVRGAGEEEDEGVEVTQGVCRLISYRPGKGKKNKADVFQGRKYLDYDIEALHIFLTQQPQQQQSRRVVVAFQDSEAFDSGLLTDLISLFQ